ncbi:hypothetical protein EK21DRAFT_51413 [Setomelanomma holmii]|uniref:Uncharacterized protein n=1 Tax=Setomelanomma holmii TaxID=210430 RepID=A0A9P4LVE2_9PLEO|nr:hypothetical protein EK21DRAFT_51413 [Setomelanomma holmii]
MNPPNYSLARGSDAQPHIDNRNQNQPPSYRASVGNTVNLDITQRLERKLAQYNASQSVFKRWLFEIVSVTTSAICMGAIIIILASLKDQALNKWPLGLTIITVLSKIASAALILPISEAIGQLKWSWFHGKESKDAFDFEIFDKASRGAWGSILLLIRTKGKSLAALGALLTVMLLAIDTFFQQVTNLPERWTERGEGLLARTTRYDPEVVWAWQSTMGPLPMAQPNQDMKAALLPLFYDRNGTEPSRNRNGSTACGYFLNTTSTKPVLMSGYRVSNGSNGTYGETLLMRTLPLVTNPARHTLYDGSINFKDSNHPILDALIVSSADGTAESVYRKDVPIAHECMLSWCVKTMQSSYSWGVYEETVVETFRNTTKPSYPYNTVYYPLPKDLTEVDYYGNVTIYPPGMSHDGPGYGVSNDTNLDAVFIFDEVFPSVITISDPTAQPFLKYRTSFADRFMWRAFHFNPWIAPNNITNHMERIATAITNVARSDPGNNEFVAGQALAPETFVKVYWAWLTFPLAMLALCLLFLVATMIKTSKGSNEQLATWKTSAMPTLIYSLPEDMRQNLSTPSTWVGGARSESKKVKIRLMPNHGWRVSGQISTTPVLLNRSNRPPPPPGWL